MARPGYMSIYADTKIQQIFDEFVKIKGISKSTALSEMIEIYMLCQDEELYLELKKKSLGVEVAKQELLQRRDITYINDFIFIKLGRDYDLNGKSLNGTQIINLYMKNCEENGLGYSWFCTESLHFGMAKQKVKYYNEFVRSGDDVKILFAVGEGINDIKYSASVLELVSSKDSIKCPGQPESVPDEFGEQKTGRIWIKINDIKEEPNLKAEMFRVRSTDSNLKQVISNSQFHFGYVYMPEN